VGARPAGSRWERAGAAASAGLSSFAGLVLAAVMLVAVVDVAGRDLLNRPLPGSSEITEILMAILVYAGLPVVSQRTAHISVDLLGGVVPLRIARTRDAVIRLLCAATLGVIAWRLWVYAGLLSRDVTEYLKLPQAPVVYVLSVFAGLASAIEFYRAFRPALPQDVFAADPA
jgi:TRAP-type C4-dicarboxylate transport system permease small subunit